MFDQVCYKTDVGKVRPHNEDAVKGYKNQHCSMMVIADGMGGHAAGEVASGMVINTISNHFDEELKFEDPEELRKWLKQLLNQINQEILTYIADHQLSHGMGTTAIVTVMTKSFIALAHIGDSRAYLLSHQRLRQITKDHTFVRKLVDEGKLSEQEAKNHPHRMVDDDEIFGVLSQDKSTEEKVNLMIEMANLKGGKDNISIALCERLEGSEAL